MRSGSNLGSYYLNSISALNLIDSVCITVHELFAKRTMPSQMSYFVCWYLRDHCHACPVASWH